MSKNHFGVGHIINKRYRIDGFIGRGGMGVVFAATDLDLDQKVALKVQRRDRRDQSVRFKNEARTGALLADRTSIDNGRFCVMTTLNYGVTEHGEPFYVMPLLEGQTLTEYLASNGRITSLAEVFKILRQTIEGIAYMHDLQIVHRDIKPENIFIELVGNSVSAIVCDYGIAKKLGSKEPALTDVAIGTPAYAAREQLLNLRPTTKVDIYSFGVVMLLLLTGQEPGIVFGEDYMNEILSATPPIPPLLTEYGDFDSELTNVVARCLSHNPKDRPDARWLVAFLEEREQAARKVGLVIHDNRTHQDMSTRLTTEMEKAKREREAQMGQASKAPGFWSTASSIVVPNSERSKRQGIAFDSTVEARKGSLPTERGGTNQMPLEERLGRFKRWLQPLFPGLLGGGVRAVKSPSPPISGAATLVKGPPPPNVASGTAPMPQQLHASVAAASVVGESAQPVAWPSDECGQPDGRTERRFGIALRVLGATFALSLVVVAGIAYRYRPTFAVAPAPSSMSVPSPPAVAAGQPEGVSAEPAAPHPPPTAPSALLADPAPPTVAVGAPTVAEVPPMAEAARAEIHSPSRVPTPAPKAQPNAEAPIDRTIPPELEPASTSKPPPPVATPRPKEKKRIRADQVGSGL